MQYNNSDTYIALIFTQQDYLAMMYSIPQAGIR